MSDPFDENVYEAVTATPPAPRDRVEPQAKITIIDVVVITTCVALFFGISWKQL